MLLFTCNYNYNYNIIIIIIIIRDKPYRSQKTVDDLANMALALALTRTMLSLPYRADAAEDLERAVRVAMRAASLSRHLMASTPQHPYVSTAKGMQTQPKRLLLLLLYARYGS